MVLGCPRGDRSSCQVITFTRARAKAKPHAAQVSRREKGPTMLNATLGRLAMVPVVFDVARYMLVFR
jgi:hypothetical protein